MKQLVNIFRNSANINACLERKQWELGLVEKGQTVKRIQRNNEIKWLNEYSMVTSLHGLGFVIEKVAAEPEFRDEFNFDFPCNFHVLLNNYIDILSVFYEAVRIINQG